MCVILDLFLELEVILFDISFNGEQYSNTLVLLLFTLRKRTTNSCDANTMTILNMNMNIDFCMQQRDICFRTTERI